MNFPYEIIFVDSHTHLDHVAVKNKGNIDFLKEKGCFAVSWSFGLQIQTVSDLWSYLEKHSETIRELSEYSFACAYLAGIHPRNIPDGLTPGRVKDLLLPFLDDPLCLGIGEIGLETGSQIEIDILSAQLDLWPEVVSRKKVFGIHTPRKNKAVVAQKTLEILASYPGARMNIVIDHCDSSLIAEALSAGYFAGITISPIKVDKKDAIRIMAACGEHISRIMLNTDSGTVFYTDLVEFVDEPGIDQEIRHKVIYKNALDFFGINLPGRS